MHSRCINNASNISSAAVRGTRDATHVGQPYMSKCWTDDLHAYGIHICMFVMHIADFPGRIFIDQDIDH